MRCFRTYNPVNHRIEQFNLVGEFDIYETYIMISNNMLYYLTINNSTN